MGVPEAEVRMVEGMYQKTITRVVMGEGASEELEVSIGLRQSSVLSAAVHTSSGPNQQEDRDKGCHEGTHPCRRPGPCGEWQTGMQEVNRSWLSSSLNIR